MKPSARSYILIVSPAMLAAKGLYAMLSAYSKYHVADVVGSLSQLTPERLKRLHPSLLVLDPSELAPANRHHPQLVLPPELDIPIVALVTTLTDPSVLSAYSGVITLYSTPQQVEQTIDNALQQHSQSATLSDKTAELSAREQTILCHVARGLSNKEIADALNLSVFTVTTHRKNITRKLGIRSISGLTIYAILNHLIEPNEL